MKLLIVGSGGREHALAWKAIQSPTISTVFVAPGNAGTALEHDIINIPINSNDTAALIKFAKQEAIELTIIGPEAPLVDGIVDTFLQANLKCFGPTAKAAQLEGSKAFSKNFMLKYNIPTAKYQTFTKIQSAISYIQSQGTPVVVKADGLASGKGVIVANTEQQAIAAAKDMLCNNKFGQAGNRIIIEDFLEGEEVSFIVLADGNNALAMATSQDHKARDDEDKGPNTGGMGAYSPAPAVTATMTTEIMKTIINPTLKGMQQEGAEYTGFLYAGLIIAKDNSIKVLEYNCRLGDPETQPIMMRLKTDLPKLCFAALDKNLDKLTIEWDERAALGVVLASKGYPNHCTKNHIISGLPSNTQEDSKVFHAATAQVKNNIITSGGRVLCACALGENIYAAQKKAYALSKKIYWDTVFCRSDIGFKAL